MSRIKISQKITIYEIDDEEVADNELSINSHWNYDNFVILKIGNKDYTVDGDDLKTAIDNAMNSGGI